jgi:hypothetical protein
LNYQKIYNDLVAKCVVRGLDKKVLNGYFEKHHILPVCLGGTDDPSNFVMFTAKEHFIAHMLLWKAYPEDLSLASAAFFMRNTRDERNKFNSKLYSKLSEDYSKVMSIRMSKENSPHYKDLTGQQKSKLTITGFSHWRLKPDGESSSYWYADCSCGNSVVVHGSGFTIGNIQSCGCLRAENIRKYPFSKKVRKAYYPLKRKYLETGELCDRWADPERGIYNFAEDVGEAPSEDLKIGRLDNTKQYSKENCAWMTTKEISIRNKKTVRNKSGRTGVRKVSSHGGKYEYWKAEFRLDGKLLDLGTRKVFEDAVKLREDAEIKYYGFIKD